MLDGNITDKIMIGVILIVAIVLSPIVLIKYIKNQAGRLTDYFSKHRVIFRKEGTLNVNKKRSKEKRT
jgi:hypothetical protein